MPNDQINIENQLVCVLPDGFQLSESAWKLIYAAWIALRDCGEGRMLSAEDVSEVVSRGHR